MTEIELLERMGKSGRKNPVHISEARARRLLKELAVLQRYRVDPDAWADEGIHSGKATIGSVLITWGRKRAG